MKPTKPEVPPETGPAAPESPPVLDSQTLFRGGAEVVIRHGTRQYRLRKTRQDKLILTA